MDCKIKPLTNLEDFKKVYKVFSEKPYCEKYSEKELEDIFLEYQEKGFLYGTYAQEECLGLIALEDGAKTEHPVNFSNEKVIYLADIAVLKPYRRHGIGNQLMLYGVMQAKALNYERIYMRTLETGSMSYGIALKLGFQQVPNALQPVEKERVDGSIQTLQNIFLDLNLKELNKQQLKRGIEIVTEGACER